MIWIIPDFLTAHAQLATFATKDSWDFRSGHVGSTTLRDGPAFSGVVVQIVC